METADVNEPSEPVVLADDPRRHAVRRRAAQCCVSRQNFSGCIRSTAAGTSIAGWPVAA